MSADPEVPSSTPPTPPPSASAGSGLPKTTAAGLASLFSLLGGIVFFLLDRKDPYVRFYSIQSAAWGALIFVFGIVASILVSIFARVPVIGGLLGLIITVVYLAWMVVWVISTVNAFRGKEWQIPYFWDFVKKYESKLPQ